MKTLNLIFKQILILFLLISFTGCEEEQISIKLPEVVSMFSYTTNHETGTVRFLNVSENATKYSWTFGDGETSTEINPIHTFATGSYDVVLTASNSAGASATSQDKVYINIPEPLGLPITFDNSNVTYDPATFDGTSFEVVANPAPGGSNNVASNVGAVTNSGAAYEGIAFELGTAIDLSTLGSIKMNFWADAPIDVLMKLEEGSTSTPDAVVSHGGTGWEEMSFDINSTSTYSKLVIFVDGPGTTTGTFYMDDITQIETPTPPAPTEPVVGAPVPTQDAANVISIFSDTYSDLTGTNLDTNWQGDITSETVTIEGNAAMKYSNAKFIGMQLAADTDLSAMEYMHIDIWTPDATVLEATPISPPNEKLVNLAGLEQGKWMSFDIPVTDFTDVDFSKILQFKIDAQKGVNPAVIFMDNLYFYKKTTTEPEPTGAYLYSTKGTVDIVTTWGDWSTGTTQDGASTEDPTYNPSIKLSGGTWGALVAFTAMPSGKMGEYANLDFKIKTPESTVKVKIPEVEKTFNIADGTALNGGWVQMSIPLSTFGSGAVDSATELAIWGSGGTTLFITDVMLSGNGGSTTPPTNDCPAAPVGELLSNGNFEAGDVGCWQFFEGTSISTTESNGGSKSAEIQGSTGKAVGIKQERFAAGTLLPNTSYTVTYDIKSDGDFGIGGVMKVFTFSEGADGGTVGATQHILADGITSLPTVWTPQTYTFTTAPNANQVEGGLSFYMEIVNSAAKLNVDNVVVKKTP